MKSTSERTKALLGGAAVLLFVCTPVGQAGAQNCVQPPSGLVSWLPGDGNTDDIVGGNNGTLVGATFEPGLVGQAAFSFDGSSSVTLSSLPAVSNVGGWTYDFWINVRSFRDQSYFVDRTDETLNVASLLALNNQFNFQTRYDGAPFEGEFNVRGGAIRVGVWTHIAMVRQYGVAFRLYVNGSLVASSPPDNGSSLTPPIPKLGHHDLATFLGFVGLIDEFEIFNRALSASEIQVLVDAFGAGKCKPERSVVTVTIDIKPGSFPNSVNLRSDGVIPVAILTTATFDATTVDSSRVRFGKTGIEAAPTQVALEDVDRDGHLDMIFHFSTQATGIVCGTTSASLIGDTLSRQPIRGADSISTVGCK